MSNLVRADDLLRAGAWHEAAGMLEAIYRQGSIEPALIARWGYALLQQGKILEAIQAWQHALGLGPAATEPIMCLIAVLCSLGAHDEAQRLSALLAANEPAHAHSWQALASAGHAATAAIYAAAGAKDAAIQQYQAAIHNQPAQIALRLALAELYLKSSEFDPALAELAKARELEPDSAEVLILQGLVAHLRKNPNEAKSYWEHAARSAPTHSIARALSHLAE